MNTDVNPNSTPPRVFLSYSWTSAPYQQGVVEFAERLMNDGVDVVADFWDLKEGQDTITFMERMVHDPDISRVLLLCDPRYAEKADDRIGGVGTESQIVSGKVYAQVTQEKFVPVIMKRTEDGTVVVPTYLSGRKYIDLSSDEVFAQGYDQLLRVLYERPSRPRPAIGKPPGFLSATDAVTPKTHLLSRTRSATLMHGGSSVSGAKGVLDSVLEDVAAQRLMSEPTEPIDQEIYSKIQEMKGLRDIALTAMLQLLQSTDDATIIDPLVAFFEGLAPLGEWPAELNQWNSECGDHIKFLAYELWLYLIAILVRERKWGVADGILRTRLCFTARDMTYAAYGYGHFNRGLGSFERRKNRLQLNRISMMADLVKERSDFPRVSFESLMEADFLLCLRGLLAQENDPQPSWHPRTLVYAGYGHRPFPIFVRWQAGRDITGMSSLIVLGTLAAVRDRLSKLQEQGVLNRYQSLHWDASITGLTGLFG